ncbi:hypothetical protein Hanom_Chr12g01141371 [Helianthus anomalus]
MPQNNPPPPVNLSSYAREWAKAIMSSQSTMISASQSAFFTNQNQSIQSLLISDSETRSGNRPPKLFHLNGYPTWKGRFITYVLGVNT